MIRNDAQLVNTLSKLKLLEQHIAETRQSPGSPEQDESIESLESLAREMKEEIVRYRSAQRLKHAV